MNKNPHRRPFSLYPLAQLSLAYIAGVFISNSLGLRPAAPIIASAVSSVLALVMLLRQRLKSAGPALLLAILFAGAALAAIEKGTNDANSLRQLFATRIIDEQQQLTLTGVLDGPPEFAHDRLHLTMRVENVVVHGAKFRASGVVALLATFKTTDSEDKYRQIDLHYGTRLRVRSTLNFTDQYRNPGVSTLTEYLERKGYDATGVIKSPHALVRLDQVAVFKPLAWLYRRRESIQLQIDRLFSAETAGVLEAALLGNRYNLSKSTGERFRDAGTFHVLVISGLHISFIGGLAFLLARQMTRKRILQLLYSGLVVWAYAFAVGAQTSVVRAALMFTFVALGRVVFRSASALNALGAGALILLVRSPKELFDPSLQLTFLPVLAIVTIAWPLLQTFKAIGAWRPTRETPYPPCCSSTLRTFCEILFWSDSKWKAELDRSAHTYRLFKTPIALWLERTHLQKSMRYALNAIVVSLSVQIVLLPLLILYFHRLSFSSVILNVSVGLLLAALAAVAVAALLISQFSMVLAAPLVKFADAINWIMVHSVDPFSRIGLASIRLPEYSGASRVIYFVYYVPLIVLLVALSRWRPLTLQRPVRRKFPGLACLSQIILLGIVFFHPWSSGIPDGKLHVDFLDVGQGDAALVTMPNGSTLLVDGGGRPNFFSTSANGGPDAYERDSRSIGELVVSEYLWWRGLDRVDYVLATHADADHIDGLNDVLKSFDVRSALVGRTSENDAEYRKFAQTILATKTSLQVVNKGDELHFGNVTATILWPAVSSDARAPSKNNDSVVLRLQFGERTILLTGDIEKEAEAQIVATTKDLHVDLIKVPHHGSRTSSTESFVSATAPQFAIISVGQTSMFGHPHGEVVERWGKSGAEVMTTGRCGTISATTDGKTMIVRKFIE